MFRSIAILAALIAVCSAPAATLRQLTMDQMAESATSIVRARVTSAAASFTGSSIYTHYKLQTTETWKGFALPEVMVPGGTANGFRQSVPGAPQLRVGAEYVLFLWTSSSTGITHLIGLSQGLFNISTQTDGTIVASRDQIGETMLDSSGAKVTDRAVRMNLSDMKSKVGRGIGFQGAVR